MCAYMQSTHNDNKVLKYLLVIGMRFCMRNVTYTPLLWVSTNTLCYDWSVLHR